MSLKKYEEYVKPRLLEVGAWARNGITEKQIAKNLGISYATFRNYKKEHLALLSTLADSKQVIDFKVENALLKRALGYKAIETTSELTDSGLVITKEVVKEVQPDVGAATFWLRNRKKDTWSDKPKNEEEW